MTDAVRLATPPVMNADDDAGHHCQACHQINGAGHAAELQRSKRERRERDNVAKRHKDDARNRENQDETQPDKDIDRSRGNAVDAEDERDVGRHARRPRGLNDPTTPRCIARILALIEAPQTAGENGLRQSWHLRRRVHARQCAGPAVRAKGRGHRRPHARGSTRKISKGIAYFWAAATRAPLGATPEQTRVNQGPK